MLSLINDFKLILWPIYHQNEPRHHMWTSGPYCDLYITVTTRFGNLSRFETSSSFKGAESLKRMLLHRRESVNCGCWCIYVQ